MSDQIKKDDAGAVDAQAPKDEELFTPQGGGGGTGSGPLARPADGPDGKAIPLPQVGPEDRVPEGGDSAEEEDSVSAFRLVSTLALAGAVAGALLVFVYLWSTPLIEAENARVLQEAVGEVLKGPAHFESIFIEEGELRTAAELTAGADTTDLEKVFRSEKELTAAGVISIQRSNGQNTIRVHLDRANFDQVAAFLPLQENPLFEVLGPEENEDTTEEEYLEMMEFMLGEAGPPAINTATDAASIISSLLAPAEIAACVCKRMQGVQ